MVSNTPQPLDHLCIVMIQTSHPGNIGSAARAMKTMGISDLRLVRPNRFNSPETRALASGANAILDNAQHFEHVEQAINDCQIVIGTSARSTRTLSWPQIDARQCGKLVSEQTQNKVAIVFGRERSGLTNEELEQCHYLAHIPMQASDFSLNIAAAVQLFCYECMMASSQLLESTTELTDEADPIADMASQNQFYEHLEQVLTESRYLDPDNPRLVMRRFRRLFNRCQPSKSEIGMLRGMLSAFQGKKFQRRSS